MLASFSSTVGTGLAEVGGVEHFFLALIFMSELSSVDASFEAPLFSGGVVSIASALDAYPTIGQVFTAIVTNLFIPYSAGRSGIFHSL